MRTPYKSYKIAIEISDIIISSPINNPFTKLKEDLIGRMSLSHWKKLLQLLNEEMIEDSIL